MDRAAVVAQHFQVGPDDPELQPAVDHRVQAVLGRGLPLDDLRTINDWAMGGRWPDLVVLLDVPGHVAAARMAKRELDRFERAGDDFHRRVVEGFRTLAAADPDRWVTVTADGDKDAVAEHIRREVSARLAIEIVR